MQKFILNNCRNVVKVILNDFKNNFFKESYKQPIFLLLKWIYKMKDVKNGNENRMQKVPFLKRNKTKRKEKINKCLI